MITFILTLFCSIAFAGTSETVPVFGPVGVGKPLPTIAGWTLEDKLWSSRRSFEAGKGKTTIISYFSTSCAPCIPGLQTLSKLNNEKTNLVLVALDTDKKPVNVFLKKINVSADNIILDKYSKIAQRHGVANNSQRANIPKTFVIDKNGIVQVIYTTEGNDFDRHINKALAKMKE